MSERTQRAEREFVLRRLVQGDYRWVGSSSDAMVTAAIEGRDAAAEDFKPIDPRGFQSWPFDGWDLGRCMVTRNVAPPHLQPAMDVFIAVASDREGGAKDAYHGLDAAKEMADQHTEEVRTLLASPLPVALGADLSGIAGFESDAGPKADERSESQKERR